MDPLIADAKRVLRAQVRQRRAARARESGQVGTKAVELFAAARAAGLLDPSGSPREVGAAVIASYLAMPGEPDPAILGAAVRTAGGQVLLPRPAGGRELEWARDDGTRGAATHPIRVPVPTGPSIGTGASALLQAGVRVLLLPALAVDLNGRRLGQGGGYYDRLLGELMAAVTQHDTGPLLVAVVHDDEILDPGSIPVEGHDQPVHAALTPSGLRTLG